MLAGLVPLTKYSGVRKNDDVLLCELAPSRITRGLRRAERGGRSRGSKSDERAGA